MELSHADPDLQDAHSAADVSRQHHRRMRRVRLRRPALAACTARLRASVHGLLAEEVAKEGKPVKVDMTDETRRELGAIKRKLMS